MPEVRLIDRQALLHDIDKEIEFFSSSAGNHDYFDYAKKNGLVIAKQIVGRQPTIDAEPVRHGRWIEVTKHRDENGTILTDYECSECCAMVKDSGAEEIESERFCYNCGAKMCVTDTNVGGKGGADNG